MEKPEYRVYFYEGQDEHFRPKHVPDDFLVFNAPRPLWGSVSPGPDQGAYTWSARGRRGLIFAAVDPRDPDFDTLVKHNNEQHGHLCVWVTAEEVERVAKEYYESIWDGRGYERPIPWEVIEGNFRMIHYDIVTGSLAEE